MALTTQTPSGLVTGINVVATESKGGSFYRTTLKLNSFTMAVAGAANEAIGYLIATFPAGGHHLHSVAGAVQLKGTGTVDADTPDVGIGTVVATGAVAVLGGTASFEDIVDGVTATDCNNTVIGIGASPDDELSSAPEAKAVYLNIADGWAGADTITVTGAVVIEWTKMG